MSRIRVWPFRGIEGAYPERATPGVEPPPLTGVCFSGGGTRSYAATMGQLRGLTKAGLMPEIGYVSAVSGSAWIIAPYCYHSDSVGESELLGIHRDPDQLALGDLETLEPTSLGWAATLDFARHLAESRERHAGQPSEVWNDAIGTTFLKPYGLYDANRPTGFTWSELSVADIRRRVPALGESIPHVVSRSSYRPYPILHATLNWPDDQRDPWESNRVGFELAPLGVGTPSALTLESPRHGPHRVGGGFIEPCGFGSAMPAEPPTPDGLVLVDAPERPLSLAEAVGASSAFSTPNRDLRMYPHATCWPIDLAGHAGVEPATSEAFSDGGDSENYGLIALLRRRVGAVVVFVNSVWPLSLEYDPSGWPADTSEISPPHRTVDPFLPPLFGAPSPRFHQNQVFDTADFAPLIEALQAAKRRGETVLAMTTHTVRANAWWGLEGGWDVRVCWVYNEYVERWGKQLPQPIRRAVADGRLPSPEGPVARFPHFLTQGQNPGALIQLSPIQVNLLAHLSCWNVVENQGRLRQFFETA